MPKKLYVETTPSGEHQFVLRRSHSHHGHHFGHHHHRHHHHHHDHCDERSPISRDEMNHLLERERILREANESLLSENHALKANWQACDQELRRVQGLIPQLQGTIRNLEHENRDLRRSLESNGDASEKYQELRRKYTKVKNDKEGLLQTIRHLQRELAEAIDEKVLQLQDLIRTLKQDVKHWQQNFDAAGRKCDALQRLNDRLRDNYDLERQKNEALEIENARLRRRLYGRC